MQTQSTETFFAPAERVPLPLVMAAREEVESFGQVKNILDALPTVAAVLNKERQILYANQALIDLLDLQTFERIMGKRVGEALNCIHAHELPNGCGTTEYCRCCGTTQAIVESQRQHARASHEARLTAMRDGKIVAYDIVATALPYAYNGNEYTILSIQDISGEKRRRALEQIFFHDIINHAQSVSGLLSCTREVSNPEEIRQLLDLAHMASMEMIDGILSQRDLLAAENAEIRLMKRPLTTLSAVEDCIAVIRHHFAAADHTVVIDAQNIDVSIETDETLLKRILTNMLKNALEATPPDGTVTVGCDRSAHGVVFWTHNTTAIPRSVQLQIFQRSYSTKGANRGLGTYSMKLLGEQYLGGKVWFTTDPDAGTHFYFELPLPDHVSA